MPSNDIDDAVKYAKPITPYELEVALGEKNGKMDTDLTRFTEYTLSPDISKSGVTRILSYGWLSGPYRGWENPCR